MFTVCVMLLYTIHSFAHTNHHESSAAAEVQATDDKQLLEQINLNYQKNVKTIFQKKCMTCHTSQTEYPFFYHWPIAKKIIDDDVAESKKHLDMTNGFPFGGHGNPVEDLEAIKKSVFDGSMPPLRYRMMHWGSGLTKSEIDLIIDWVNESSRLLKNANADSI
jgi:hypothetical protein